MAEPIEFRDIIADLESRLKRISTLRDAAQRRYEQELKEIAHEETLLREMIALEEKHKSNGHAPLATHVQRPLRAGAQNRTEHEILEFLSDEEQHPFHGIKMHVLSVGIGNETDPNFGRSLQGTLLSLRGRELVEIPEGTYRTWKITKKGLTGG